MAIDPSDPIAPTWLIKPDDANALAPAIWSGGTLREASGVISIGQVVATDLAATFGTPCYIYDEHDARNRATEFRECFEREFTRIGTSVTVYYAGKAFLCTEVVRWMIDAGLNIDVCSQGELAVALAAEAPADRIGFHGNNKSVAEIERAVVAGVGVIVLDSLIEIQRVADVAARASRVQAVRLRVNSGIHADTHAHLATAHEDQKFGIALEDTPDAVARIRSHASLEFRGLHCHIGSQIFGAEGFAASAALLLGMHARLLEGGPVPELNLGGGFGIAYTAADDPTPISVMAVRIADGVAAECTKLGIAVPVIAFEPGRWIIGPAGITLYEVGTIKPVRVAGAAGDADAAAEAAVRTYVSVDGGMSDNARPALYGADYSARLANRVSDAEPILVRVAGKHCESGDIVVDADYLPADLAPGDLLAVAATGAYCWSLASNYNYLGRPPVVAVRDGKARIIIRGESEVDLLSRDAGIDVTATSAGKGTP